MSPLMLILLPIVISPLVYLLQGRFRLGSTLALATMAVEEDAQEDARDKAILRASLGLPVADVFRDGPDPLRDAVLARGGGKGA